MDTLFLAFLKKMELIGSEVSDIDTEISKKGKIITRDEVTTEIVTNTLPEGESFADYKTIIFDAQINGTSRGTLCLPYSIFSNGQDCYIPAIAGTTSVNVYIAFVSNTSYKVKCDDSRFNYITIFGG